MNKKKVVNYGIILLVALLGSAGLLLYNANKVFKYELERRLNGFSVESIDLKWGGVEAIRIDLLRPDKKTFFRSEKLSVSADFISLFRKENNIGIISLDAPVIVLETDRNGKMMLPDSGKKRKKQQKQDPAVNERPYSIKRFEVRNGSLDYVDRKISAAPVTTSLREMKVDAEDLEYPFAEKLSKYKLSAVIPGIKGNGSLKADGLINLNNLDTNSRLEIKDLDITGLRPYYAKKGDVEVTKGFLSISADVNIVKTRIASSGKMTLKKLEFDPGKSGTFLGLPLSAVMSALKNSRGEIELDFTLEGDLNNPKFSITDSLVQKLTISLAKALGLPIETIGRTIFDVGGDVIKKIFK
jgi:hypothetical protein